MTPKLPSYDQSEGHTVIDPEGRLWHTWRFRDGVARRNPEHAARVVAAWWYNERERLLTEEKAA